MQYFDKKYYIIIIIYLWCTDYSKLRTAIHCTVISVNIKRSIGNISFSRSSEIGGLYCQFMRQSLLRSRPGKRKGTLDE